MFRRVLSGLWAVCVCVALQTGVAHAAAPDVVLYASDAANLHGNWARVADPTGAGGQTMTSADRGWSSTAGPLAAPADYFDFTFTAPANTPFHVWMRLRATANSKYNDALFAQFSDARDAGGASIFALGSTSGLTVNLATDASGLSLNGWGWEDGAYWLSQATTIRFATAGTHTLRIQTREDGLQLDQVVLSASAFLTSSPGPVSNDVTIVPKTIAGPTPYTGTAVALPGTVRVENFDYGGEGVAYHDTTAGNAGSIYRSSDVDIQASSLGGYNVGWAIDGEWLAYTVNVATSGLYLVQFQVAAPVAVGQIHASFGSANTATVAIPNTGGWQNWTTVGVTANLAAGSQLMKVVFDAGGFNLAGVTATFIPPPAVPVPQTPDAGAISVTTSPALSWSAAGASSYDVRFGTTNPPGQVATGLSSASYSPSGLTNGTTYFWQIIARNSGGTTAGPVASFTTIVSPPATPVVQTPISGATDIAVNTNVSWTAGGATSYDVRFGTTNPPPAVATNVASASYSPTGLINDTTYFWQVTARNAGGTTAGPVASFTTIVAPPATPVVQTPINGATDLAINTSLTWSAAGATSYDVRFGTTSPPPAVATNLSSASYAPNGLLNDTTYFWQVTARNAGGTTTGPVASFTTIVAPPATPVVQTPVNGATDIAINTSVTWSAAGATSYDVRFGTTTPPPAVATNVASASYSPSGLINDTTYFWQVTARNAGGTTVGPIGSFTTIVAPPATPVVQTPATGATGVAINASVSWSATGATSYDLRFGTTNPPPAVASNLSSATFSPGSPSGLLNDTTYFWQVTARNAGGTTVGPIGSFTTIVAPPATPVVQAPATGATGVALNASVSWNAAGATSYDVRFGTTNPPAAVANGVTTASYTPAGLTNGTTYFWQIVARNDGGSSTGPVSSFTTLPAPTAQSDIVIYASDIPASALHGSWRTDVGPTSPHTIKLVTPDNGVIVANNPLAAPTDYVDATFNAAAAKPYRIWMRMTALGNSKYNDAVWLQFSDALVNGTPTYVIGTTAGLLVNLATDAAATSLNGWGWQNTAYWLTQPTTVSFATSGPHTVRIQVREDGVQFDQIVLSPATYLNAAPGPVALDNTIVPKPAALLPPAAPSLPTPGDVAIVSGSGATLGWTAAGATGYDVRFGTTSSPSQVAWNITTPTYDSAVLAAGTTYFWQVVARNANGTTTGPVWSFVTAVPPPPPPPPVAAPMAYNAVTNRIAYPEPPLPLLGPAGSIFPDPTFGSRILRVTDGNTRPGALARSYDTPSASHQNAWNTASTYFYTRSTDGTYIPYAFNPSTMTASRIQPSASGDGGLTVYSNTEPQFSFVSPNVLFGARQDAANDWPVIRQYDFSTNSYTDLLNLGQVVAIPRHTYAGGVSSSAGSPEKVATFFGGAAQDSHYLVAVFTMGQGTAVVLNTLDSTITANGVTSAVNITLNFHLHHAWLDESGRYVVMDSTAPDRLAPRLAAAKYIWDTTTNNFTALSETGSLSGGHYSTGFGVMINHDCCTTSAWDAGQWQIRWLSAPAVTGDLVTPVQTPKEIYLGDHNSWNNAQPGALVPFVAAFYRYGTNTVPWRAWDEEIVAVQTNAGTAGATVWRFAHHRSDIRNDLNPTNPAFWYEPRPNVSQDGRWAIFTSNWEKSLGTDAYGQTGASFRQDVFLVALTPAP